MIDVLALIFTFRLSNLIYVSLKNAYSDQYAHWFSLSFRFKFVFCTWIVNVTEIVSNGQFKVLYFFDTEIVSVFNLKLINNIHITLGTTLK